MKNLFFEKLLILTGAFCLLFFSLALFGFIQYNVQAQSVEETLSRPEKAVCAETDDNDFFDESSFYIVSGASVRVSSSGIKFTTIVSKEFHDQISKDNASVTYFATAKKVGGKNELTSKLSLPNEANGEGLYQLNTYLNFIGVEASQPDRLLEYYSNEYTTSTFAKVVSQEGATTYYKAYSLENDGTYDIVRSMRAVGNAACLNWSEESDYPKSAVEKYFNVGNRSGSATAYQLESGKLIFKMPNYEFDGERIDAYVGARKYTAVYDKESNSYTIENCEGKAQSISVFGEDNCVYSTDVVEAKELATEADLISLRNLSGTICDNYVLTADITCVEPLTACTTNFCGVLDGMGKVLTFAFEDNQTNKNAGLFYSLGEGVRVRNLNILNEGLSNNGGVIAYKTQENSIVNLENIVIDVKNIPQNGAPVVCVNSGSLIVKNSAIFVRDMSVQEIGGGGSKFVWENLGDIRTDSVYIAYKSIENNSEVTRYSTNDDKISGSIYSYRFFGGLFNGLLQRKIVLPKEVKSGIYKTAKNVTLLNNDNVKEAFSSVETGDVILTENIDLSKISWLDAGEGSVSSEYKNYDMTFDGAGYTVSNIKIASGSYNGFFTTLAGNSYVVNTTFKISGFESAFQGLIGKNLGATTLYNVTVQTAVKLKNYSGLVAVYSNSPITMKQCAILYEYKNGFGSNSALLCCNFGGSASTIRLDGVIVYSNSSSPALVYKNGKLTLVGMESVDYILYSSGVISSLVAPESASVNLLAGIERAKAYYSS